MGTTAGKHPGRVGLAILVFSLSSDVDNYLKSEFFVKDVSVLLHRSSSLWTSYRPTVDTDFCLCNTMFLQAVKVWNLKGFFSNDLSERTLFAFTRSVWNRRPLPLINAGLSVICFAYLRW